MKLVDGASVCDRLGTTGFTGESTRYIAVVPSSERTGRERKIANTSSISFQGFSGRLGPSEDNHLKFFLKDSKLHIVKFTT